MFQDYLQQSTKKVIHTVEIAVAELAALKQNLLTPDFLLLALVSQPDSEATKILEHLVSDPVAVVSRMKGQIHQRHQRAAPVQATQIVSSQEVADVFRTA